jgi:hypothetical protein
MLVYCLSPGYGRVVLDDSSSGIEEERSSRLCGRVGKE